MARYRSIPVEVDALQLTKETVADVEAFVHARVTEERLPGPGRGMHDAVIVTSLDRKVEAQWGDWILRFDNGVFRAESDDRFQANFAKTYDPEAVELADPIASAAERIGKLERQLVDAHGDLARLRIRQLAPGGEA